MVTDTAIYFKPLQLKNSSGSALSTHSYEVHPPILMPSYCDTEHCPSNYDFHIKLFSGGIACDETSPRVEFFQQFAVIYIVFFLLLYWYYGT